VRRRIAWLLMTLLACGVSAYAVSLLLVPALRPPFIRERLLTVPAAVYLHLGASALAIAIGPFQFLASIRARALGLHRWMGRLYATAVLLGGLSGFALATMSQGGLPAHIGFALLACAWLFTTGSAYVAIRRGDVANHRRWMTRSFALTLAAVTLRIYVPVSLLLGVPFELGYPAIAWLCWVPNLAIAEWRFVGRTRGRPAVAGV
jgi:uncharacterized membrane protein